MPRLKDETTMQDATGTVLFSGVRPEKLVETEYTLVTIIVDVTGSVSLFADDLLKCLQMTVKGCQSPTRVRVENLLARVLTFNTSVQEVHGFRLITEIDAEKDYQPFTPDGRTAIYDAVYDGVVATIEYAKTLAAQSYNVNAAVYIITDGMDNASKSTKRMIAEKVREARSGEEIESLLTVLVGINTGNSLIEGELKSFVCGAELTAYIDAGDVTPAMLARLANFVTTSIVQTSQKLGTGQSVQSVKF